MVVTTEYFTNGSTILAEKTGNDIIWYIYDSDGDLLGFTYNDTPYYYVKNVQGDVYKVVNSNGQVVASYTYDAWGKVLTATGAMADINPIRYRGYYYDSETGLYYLNSRYYDPETGRFVNADGVVSGVGGDILGYNMFAYGFNNPINMSDNDGTWPKWATKVAIGVGIIAVAAAVTIITGGAAAGSVAAAIHCVAHGALVGAVTQGAVGAATGAVSGAVTHRLTTGSWSGAGQAAIDGAATGFMKGVISGAITGGINSPYCFVAGTTVLTAAGAAAIETIQAGDMVWAWNEETGEVVLKEVVETYINETDELVHVFVKGEEIVTTPGHPFYSPVKGWIKATHLRTGDILLLVNGEYVVVEKVQHEILESPVTVYNFQVEDYHTYYVTNVGVLVHNMCTTKKRGPKPKGTGAHNKVIEEIADDIEKNNIGTVIAGGHKPEILIRTPGGYKTGRRPDLLIKRNNGLLFGINVGKTSASGAPVTREIYALYDLEDAGIDMFFVGYN